MIDSKFIRKIVDTTNMDIFTFNGYWLDVHYEPSIMESYIEAFIPGTDENESIKVYFDDVVDKPSQIFSKKFFEGMANRLNESIN